MKMTSNIPHDFSIEEFKWRTIASSVWVILLTPFVVFTYIMLLNMSLWSPIHHLCGAMSNIFSISTILLCLVIQIISVLSTYSHKRVINVNKTFTHLNILQVLRPKQLVTIISFMVCSLICTMMLLPLKTWPSNNDNSIWMKEEEYWVLMMSYSLFLSILYGVRFYNTHQYQICFPVIQQKRLFQIKKAIHPALTEGIIISLRGLKLFIPICFAVYFIPHALVLSVVDLSLSGSYLLNWMLKFCDVSLIWSWFLTSVFISTLLIISNKIVHVLFTEHLHFLLETNLLGDEGKSLTDGMTSINPIMKNLAYLDYCFISKTDGNRRSKMYELSLPGNQPHLWNKTSLHCLQQLEKQRLELINECERKELGKRLQQTNGNGPRTINSQDLFSPVKDTNVLTDQQKPIKSKQALQPVTQRKEYLFENLQIILWSIEGLCNLVAHSINEDTYGVVQKNLPSIITEILCLLEACESFTKTCVSQQPVMNSVKEIEISQQEMIDASSLKIALKSGIYTITTAFKQHTTALRLSADHRKRIMAFIEYDE